MSNKDDSVVNWCVVDMGIKKKCGFRLPLIGYDLIIYLGVVALLFAIYSGVLSSMSPDYWLSHMFIEAGLAGVLIFGCRWIFKIYKQLWRYGGIQCYIRLLFTDGLAFAFYYVIERMLPIVHFQFPLMLSFVCVDLLVALAMRMVYRYAYKCGGQDNFKGKILRGALRFFSMGTVTTESDPDSQKIKIAIIGAGSLGVALAEDLRSNPKTNYVPRCFVDNDAHKVGKDVHGIEVIGQDANVISRLRKREVQEVVLAISKLEAAERMAMYDFYKKAGFNVKTYDYPEMKTPGNKRELREFRVEDLLFRHQIEVINEDTAAYYKDKVVLITGGGGSIGSELCRQLAKMEPRQLVLVDIYENGVYDVQQELKFYYKDKLDVKVEIVSITNKKGLSRVFEEYHPHIVINAAAHKHVPLMEKNCIEAVENNIFGALNVVQCCEEFGAERFMMVSTDKAVNPTNVMGATKRFCEYIMQAYSTNGRVKCSATRFGNVLGSAGSVIPLFKKQIAAGGPITLTDKRIIRYFMTIPEASQLVLESGAMANNGDLFVLDMGKPVKIYDLAKTMIQMSGREDVEIIETGLRPGEKLYEELLVKSETLGKTENELIFTEHDEPVTMDELNEKLGILRESINSDDDLKVKAALHRTVKTYVDPRVINAQVDQQSKIEQSVSSGNTVGPTYTYAHVSGD